MFATSLGVVFGSLISLGILFALIVSLISYSTLKFNNEIDSTTLKKDRILEVKLNYPIEEYGSHDYIGMIDPELKRVFNHKAGLYNINLALQKAISDDKIKGIYLNLSEIDAGWASLKSIRSNLQNFKNSKKIIYAFSNSYNEKSYYLASVADKIFLHHSGDFELNGLSLSPLFLKGLLEKLELKPEIFRVGKFKSAIEPLIAEKMSAENSLQNKILLSDIWNDFSYNVSTSRGIPMDKLNSIVNNLEIRNILKAKEFGLIDDFKKESHVIDDILSTTKIKIDPKKELPFISLSVYMSNYSFKELIEQTKEEKSKSKTKLALIFINGEIVNGSGNNKNFIGDEDIVSALRQAKRDEKIAGVVLRINSPGGSALASDIIWAEIEELKKRKPVYSSFGDVAASGGYYVAAGTNKIFAQPNSITGSIGVFGVVFNTKDFFHNKLGITFDNIKTHQYSDIGESNKLMTREEKSIIQKSVEKVYTEFTSVVSVGRNISMDKINELAEGRLWSGAKAKEIGLVDNIGDLNDTIAALAKEVKIAPTQIEIFPRDKVVSSFMKNLFSSIGLNLKISLGLNVPFLTFPFEAIKESRFSGNIINKSGIYTRIPYDLNIE